MKWALSRADRLRIFVIPSAVEESLISKAIPRSCLNKMVEDVSTSLDMTKGGVLEMVGKRCQLIFFDRLFVIPSEAEESLTIFDGARL